MAPIANSPVVAAHVLLYEPGPDDAALKKANPWDEIPGRWELIRFDAVDTLYLSPFVVGPEPEHKDTFGLATVGKPKGEDEKNPPGTLDKRLEWVIKRARFLKPDIKIIALQWWGGATDYTALSDPQSRKTYVASVKALIDEWQGKVDSNTGHSLRIDGYDVDYEWSPDGDKIGNQREYAPELLSNVRKALDDLSNAKHIPRFQVSVSAASAKNLDSKNPPHGDLAADLDYVTMQNYSGGQGHLPNEYLKAIPGLHSSQFVWGVTSEGSWDNDTVDPFSDWIANWHQNTAYSDDYSEWKGPLGGIMNWRINSDNWVFQNMFQLALYDTVHPSTSPLGLGPQDKKDFFEHVKNGWPTVGLTHQPKDDKDPRVIAPGYTEEDFRKAVYNRKILATLGQVV